MEDRTFDEREEAAEILLSKRNDIVGFIEENFEQFLWREKIIKSEKASLKEYFGESIEVPKLPAEITKEKMEFWKNNKLKLHYSPGIEIKEDNEFPGQEKKLDEDIYKWIKEKKIAEDAATLPKGWILIDERPKPQYKNGQQMYEEDILAPILADLREKGLIEDFAEKGSRFNISHDELNKPEVKAAIAEALKIKPKQLELPKYALFNFIGNKSHPEWGETDTSEWSQDEYTGGWPLDGGDSVFGGLSCADRHSSGYRISGLGFRLSVRFSL